MTINSDTACLPLIRSELRLPTVARLWGAIGETAVSRVGTPHARLPALLDHEVAERANRRIARHLADARLPVGKTFDSFDLAGHANGQPCPGSTRSRQLARYWHQYFALRPAWRRQDAPTRRARPCARRSRPPRPLCPHYRPGSATSNRPAGLRVAAAIEKLDKYRLLILDDLSYVRKSQIETSVLFNLIGARCERCSILITANQPFGAWDDIFSGSAMTVAAIDRLVHHAIIEMNTASDRRKAAQARAPDPHP